MAGRPRLALVTDRPVSPPWIRLLWAGDVDICSVRPLASELEQACDLDPLVLEVDLTGVTFMDSAGLSPLVEAQSRLQHRIRLFDPAPSVMRVLRLLGLEDMFLVVGPLPSGAGAGAVPPPVPLSDVERVRIEQAKGVLMAVHGCDESPAWEVLRVQAEARGVPVHVMAALVVAHAPGTVPTSSQAVVDDVMAERARAPSPVE